MEEEAGSPYIITLTLTILFIYAFAMYKVVKKAGFGWKMTVFIFIPYVGYIGLLVFAFIEWPIQKIKKVAEKKHQLNSLEDPSAIQQLSIKKQSIVQK